MARIVALLLWLWACSGSADSLGLFADSLGTNCVLNVPYPGPGLTAYVVGEPPGDGAASTALRLVGLPSAWGGRLVSAPNANFVLGNLFAEGLVIGRTDRLGEFVTDRRVGVGDFAATVYSHLGIDYENTVIHDPTGRPIPILPEGRPIPELMSS